MAGPKPAALPLGDTPFVCIHFKNKIFSENCQVTPLSCVRCFRSVEKQEEFVNKKTHPFFISIKNVKVISVLKILDRND